ncbi:MAG: glycosyltransferase, partial [Chloroflexus sp.]|nr:glycosyltransferase [Chloroflexus sp.]
MIDVIIPNYNGSALLPVCLDSLRAQTRRDFTVTVVDDASTDDSVAIITSRYPEVQVLRLAQNRGFAAAVNAGLAVTHQPFVALLNNDTEADPNWLAALIGALERWPQFAFA